RCPLSPSAQRPRDPGIPPDRLAPPRALAILLMADKPTAVIAEPPVPLRERAPIVSKPPTARSQALLPFIAAAVLLAAWQILAQVFSLPIYIAPTPMQVARTLVSELPTLMRNFVLTAPGSLAGV